MGSTPDSLYRVQADSESEGRKLTKVLRVVRWPIALITICAALAAFVYFIMPENLESTAIANRTYWETVPAGIAMRRKVVPTEANKDKNKDGNKLGTKPSEIDFYEPEDDRKNDTKVKISTSTTSITPTRKLPIPPVFPDHLTPEVQYGNENADLERRTGKYLEGNVLNSSTPKPHITQKPEKPLAIYFKEANAATTETITRAETVNDVSNYNQQAIKKTEDSRTKWHPIKDNRPTYKDYIRNRQPELVFNEDREYYNRVLPSVNFTSGHSNLFGISIEDAEKMKSTTQNTLYHTRVSPTLPSWHGGDDSTTKNYPTNNYADVQCTSTYLPMCRGVLPYDLAGVPVKIGNIDLTSLLSQIDYLVSINCSDRVRHFVCPLLEPECSPPPYPQNKPCYNLCKAIIDSCDGQIPRELLPVFDCKQYGHHNCVAAKAPCYNREFACDDGSCVPQEWVCDGRNDCSKGEDERKCTQCDQNEFRCPSGGCIPKGWMCDGFKDCSTGEDESTQVCGSRHVAGSDREADEETAGSVPSVAVKKPNKYPTKQKSSQTLSNENDNSKEILVTSYSSNPVPPKRLYVTTPYRFIPQNRTSKLEVNKTPKPEQNEDNDEITTTTETESPKNLFSQASFELLSPDLEDPVPDYEERSHKTNAVKNIEPVNTRRAQKEKINTETNQEMKFVQKQEKHTWGPAHTSPCPSGELRCVDGRCITLAQLCDGTLDCSDHADEDNCYT